ncbi:MAG TPA: hypothetical protein GXX38_07710 [Clostridia bacterium]|jgi:hypothetical protein|nr:hypothetical protein [Clostridia bacterium]
MSRVYLLGAGFSQAAGAPLLRDAMKKGVLACKDYANLGEVKIWLEKLFAPQHGVDSLNFEEVLSRLDLELHYNKYEEEEKKQLELVKEEVVSLFLNALEQCSKQKLPEEYYIFARRLQPEDVVINLNYDLVLENALLATKRFYPDYKLLFSGQTVPGLISFPVLKPHGSLNLYYCPHCLRVCQLKTQDYSGIINKYRILGGCGHFLRPLIITPTLYKSYGLEEMRQIWFNCLTALIQAQKIIFIGYSLPKADVLVAQMLDFAQRLNKNNLEVEVVNGISPDLRAIASLYQGRIINSGKSFREWVKGV